MLLLGCELTLCVLPRCLLCPRLHSPRFVHCRTNLSIGRITDGVSDLFEQTEAPGFPNIQTISPEEAANRQALEQRLQASGAGGEDKPSSADAAPSADSAAAAGGEAAEAEAGEQAAEGLQQSDIDVVMSQAKCSRDRAIKALREQNGEIVNACVPLKIARLLADV